MKVNFEEVIKDIKETLKVEKKTFKDGGETDVNVEGWIEALEYVLVCCMRFEEKEECPYCRSNRVHEVTPSYNKFCLDCDGNWNKDELKEMNK